MKCEGETCKNYWSYSYLKMRFGTYDKKCGYDKEIVDILHNIELQARKETLRRISDMEDIEKELRED